MKKTDTRIQYTKARFAEAMLELIEQKPVTLILLNRTAEEKTVVVRNGDREAEAKLLPYALETYRISLS